MKPFALNKMPPPVPIHTFVKKQSNTPFCLHLAESQVTTDEAVYLRDRLIAQGALIDPFWRNHKGVTT